MKKTLIFTSLLAILLLSGCTKQPQYIGDGSGSSVAPVTMGIDKGDFEKAAMDATQSLLSSGTLNKPGGGRYVVAIDQVINDTTQRIDTDILIKKIRIAMLKSGKAVVTSAIKVGGAESTLSHSVRDLRDNDEINQNTIAKKGTMIAPDMGLSGKIIQRNAKTIKGDQLVEYYFQLTLTELASGLAFWEDEIVVGKLGSNKTVTW
ncbi:MAG: penicillin-binding protein activator LpoB [Campylobacter sputorum]|uniref:penicillin-binding protein activator LpoB n=1 Tax=Campylobacter sputorum TaxID=206 RepID=UPI000B789CF5|nr:penicillin-binding protein activator LpoB [Campylobacter sputorum]ASM37770.1 putative lipoprotein [Campylobacter sputorum bv. paraureolyticus LMG 11764]MDY6119932.1 penicillin-binding protein activator LpoB [Campylobacter sputorum]